MSSSTLTEPILTAPTPAEATPTTLSFFANQDLILNELTNTLAQVSEAQASAAIHAILTARRIFVTGASRSGLALKMAAMRLMHLGLTVHIVGEITTPAIAPRDLLIAASGSGTTPSVVLAAHTAAEAGANVLAITTARRPPSPPSRAWSSSSPRPPSRTPPPPSPSSTPEFSLNKAFSCSPTPSFNPCGTSSAKPPNSSGNATPTSSNQPSTHHQPTESL